MTKLCNSCEYLKFCARSGIEEVGCDRYKRDTTTNEEYLKSCNTEQLAEELLTATMSDVLYAKIIPCKTHEDAIRVFREWLKQPHNNEVEK